MADIKDFNEEAKKLMEQGRAKNPLTKEIDEAHEPTITTPFSTREGAEKNDEQLRNMNETYAFVRNIGGKPAIMCKLYNEYYKKEIVDFITAEGLNLILRNKQVDSPLSKTPVKLSDWWLGHQFRKDYETITFEPDKPPGEYTTHKNGNPIMYWNMWEGWAIEPKKGCWKKARKHIWEILCNKDKKKFKYVMRWFAWAVQNPGDRAQTAIIFKGKKGSGKGTILQAFVEIFGRHGLCIGDSERLTGKHNAHLEQLSFLFADEGSYKPGDRESEGILKNLITEPSLAVEPKFRNLKTSRNCLHIAMATNADFIIPATEDERRFFINETDNKYSKGSSDEPVIRAYFNALYNELDNGGKAAMLYDLLKVKLKRWHPRMDIPHTDELQNQIDMNYPHLKKGVCDMLTHGVFPGVLNGKGEYQISSKNFLTYLEGETNVKNSFTNKSVVQLVKVLKVQTHRSSTERLLIFPELGIMRDLWNKHIGRRDWRTNEKWSIGKMEY